MIRLSKLLRSNADSILVPRPQYEDADMTPDMALRPESQRRPRLSRFLDDLAVRNNDSPYDINDTNLRTSAAMKASSGLSASASVSGPGMGSGMTLVDPTKEGASPEADSFAFLEMLLESLAVLGKLGNALDITAQRVPAEIYALTDATLDEVTERAEFARRENMLGAGDVGRLDAYASLLSTMSSTSSHLSAETLVVATTRGKEGLLPASALRSVALESSSKHTDHEILRDLFWTLYSKLHAVVQGLRIISEVVNRIGAVRQSSLWHAPVLLNLNTETKLQRLLRRQARLSLPTCRDLDAGQRGGVFVVLNHALLMNSSLADPDVAQRLHHRCRAWGYGRH
jgi:hypothetical protein